jgi:hypothetical protein
MKYQKVMKYIILICFVTLSFVQISNSQNRDKIVGDFIAGQARKANADEYEEAWKILRSDVNNDGKADLVALYTLESFDGNNNNIQYLAVFLGSGKTFRLAGHESVGGKNYRGIELISIKKQIIYLDTLEYLPTDASCCPSKKGKTRYRFRNGKFRELK